MDTNETTIYTAVVITCIVIGTIILYFAITMFRNHRKHFLQLREYYRFEVELLETERDRIARDLHDELGPLLAVTHLQLQRTTGENENDVQHLQTARNNIVVLSQRFRGIAKNLTPKVLKDKGLKAALEDILLQYNENKLIQYELIYGIETVLPQPFSLHIYRIVQELLHNAHKHSESNHVLLQLAERKEMLYLFYKDNGKGLPAEVQSNGSGIGNINRRVDALGGSVSYSSERERGMSYFFTLPIPKNVQAYD